VTKKDRLITLEAPSVLIRSLYKYKLCSWPSSIYTVRVHQIPNAHSTLCNTRYHQTVREISENLVKNTQTQQPEYSGQTATFSVSMTEQEYEGTLLSCRNTFSTEINAAIPTQTYRHCSHLLL